MRGLRNGIVLHYSGSESDLRRALVKSKLAISAAECTASTSNLPRSDSMDSMLGDSLLDPPQSLQKIPPKRYQSPSRCGSPSLEAPEHLLFGLPGVKRDSAYGKLFLPLCIVCDLSSLSLHSFAIFS